MSLNISCYGSCRGSTGYDYTTRSFIKEWHMNGANIQWGNFANWSNFQGPTTIDDILNEAERTRLSNVDFHINFCLLDQALVDFNTCNVCYTMFESSKIPMEWVISANRMDHIFVPTTSSRKAFIESGVLPSKVSICPIPMDCSTILAGGTTTNKKVFAKDGKCLNDYKHRFLNVSEMIDRKNIRGLLQTWVSETKPEDDACLVLKLNCNNYSYILDFFKEKLEAMVKSKTCAPVYFFTDNLLDSEMLDLYKWATHYITASFGEGWGLSECTSGILGKKVIAPKSSAFLDYLNEENSYPVMVSEIAADQTGPTARFYHGSRWWAPVQFNFKKVIRKSINDAIAGDTTLETKLAAELKDKYDAPKVVAQLSEFMRNFKPVAPRLVTAKPSAFEKINWMMICKSLGTKCGIADYTENLFKACHSDYNKKLYNANLLVRGDAVGYGEIIDSALLRADINVINLQLEYQFISPKRLKLLVDYCKNSGVKLVITMHTVNPRAYDYHEILIQAKCPLIVSSQIMKETLYKNGFAPDHNIQVIPMGIGVENMAAPDNTPKENFKLGFFGFGYFHKGIDKILQYMRVHGEGKEALILSTKPENDTGYYDKLVKLHEQTKLANVKWVKEHLDEVDIVKQLSTCDLIFLPYSEYGGYGVSAAIRMCLKAGVPIVSFENCFFKDCVADAGLVKFVGKNPDHFNEWASNLNRFIKSMQTFELAHVKEQYVMQRDKFVQRYNWDEIAHKYLLHFQKLAEE